VICIWEQRVKGLIVFEFDISLAMRRSVLFDDDARLLEVVFFELAVDDVSQRPGEAFFARWHLPLFGELISSILAVPDNSNLVAGIKEICGS